MIGEPQEAETSWSFAEGLRGCAFTTILPSYCGADFNLFSVRLAAYRRQLG